MKKTPSTPDPVASRVSGITNSIPQPRIPADPGPSAAAIWLWLLAFLALYALLFTVTAKGDVTNVETRVTFTNLVRGVTNGDTITIQGDVRRYTNGTLAAAATWIQSTNIPGHAATNTQIHLATYGVTGIDRVFTTNTNAIIIVSALGVFPTVTLSSGVGTVSYATNVWAEATPLLFPNAALYNEAGRTNNASGLIDIINDNRPTNVIANSLPAWTNILDRISQQTSSNKVFYTTTNNGGLSDGVRITNFVHLSGSNGTLADLVINRGRANLLTNLTATNVFLTNVHLAHITFSDANLRGTNVGLTNGFSSALTNINPVTSNLVNYGSAIRSEGPGGNSFQIGSNAWALGTRNVAVGNSTLTTNTDAIAIGTGATATNDYSIAIGVSALTYNGYAIALGQSASAGNASIAIGASASASTAGDSAVAIGNSTTAAGTGGVAVGSEDTAASGYFGIAIGAAAQATAAHAMAIGSSASSGYSNSVALGPPDHAGTATATTTTNQIRLGTANHVVSVPGFIRGTVSNLVTAAGQTNVLAGDLSTPRAAITTIANGANTISMGTNVVLDLTGSPTTTWSLDGIQFGSAAPRDGHRLWVRNITGYDATFAHNSGLEPTAAYRISTATSTNVIFTNGATAELIYFDTSSRWILWSVWDGRSPVASATNAVNWLDGAATNLTVYGSGKPPLRIWPETGSVSNRLEILTTNGALSTWVGTNGTLVASNMAVTPFSSQVELPYRLFTITNLVLVTNATAETAMLSNMLGTATIPANWWTPGKTVQLSLKGRYFNGITTTYTNWVRLGSTMLATNHSPIIASTSGDVWTHSVLITCLSTGASGVFVCNGETVINNTAGSHILAYRRIHNAAATATIDTTAAQTINFSMHPGATTQAFHLQQGYALVIP